MNTLAAIVKFRILVVLVLSVLIASAIVPNFFSLTTLSLGVDRSAALGLIAVGLTVALIAGQIDLSVGSIFALSGIIAIMAQPSLGLFPAAALGVLVGGLCGFINGVMTVVFKVNALVSTLATMLIFRAIAHWVTESQPLSGGHILFSIKLADIYLGLFTVRSALFIVLAIALHIWLVQTVGGRNLFAVGSNRAAAEASGVASDRVIFGSFIFCGIMAGLSGVLQSLITNTGSPLFGSELILPVIAAVIIGGTRLEGGRGSALGTLGGVIALTCITLAMEFESIPTYYQQIVTGFVLLLLIVLDRTVGARPTSGSLGLETGTNQ